jgi:hypothetical protein
MIKVEKVNPGGLGYVTKEGNRIQLRYGILMTRAEYATVEIEKGSVVFSVDESELVTLSAPEPVLEKVDQEPVKPVIVRPAPRTKK